MVRGLPNCEQALFASWPAAATDIRGIVYDRIEGVGRGLNDAATPRLANQVARAYSGRFGARSNLRMIVRSAARQMLLAGASPDAVASTLERYVLNQIG